MSSSSCCLPCYLLQSWPIEYYFSFFFGRKSLRVPPIFFYCAAVDAELISTEEEEVICEIDRKESIKACSDENENNTTEAPSADFVVSEHEKSTLETICNHEVPLKEIIPVCGDLSLRKEKRKGNMIWCECDFKDELNEDKEDTHGMILELYFDDKPTVGVDTFEGNDYGASEGLGNYQKGKD